MSLAAEHTEWGDIQISDQALAAIVGIATREFSDIVGMESTLIHDISSMFGKDPNTLGVSIDSNENEVKVDLYLRVKYGLRIPDLTLRLQEAVRSTLEKYTGVTVLAINVYVQSIAFEPMESVSDDGTK